MITDNHYAMVFDVSIIRNKILEYHRLPDIEINTLIKSVYERYLVSNYNQYHVNEIRYQQFPIDLSTIGFKYQYPLTHQEKEYIDIADIIIQDCIDVLEDQLVLLYDTVNLGQSIKRGIDIVSYEVSSETLLIHYILI